MLANHRKQTRSIKNIQLGLGFYYMMKYFVPLLRYNMEHAHELICNNYTSVFSCVPGPLKSWVFCGSQVKEMYYVVPGVGRLGCGIGFIT